VVLDYEVKGVRPRGRPNEDLERGCGKRLSDPITKQPQCCGPWWRKLIEDIDR